MVLSVTAWLRLFKIKGQAIVVMRTGHTLIFGEQPEHAVPTGVFTDTMRIQHSDPSTNDELAMYFLPPTILSLSIC